MTLPVYPDTPAPLRVTPRTARWPVVEHEFDGIYRQVRALTNRPLREYTLLYDQIRPDERDVIDAFFHARRGKAERFDFLIPQEYLFDGGFELPMDADYRLGVSDLVKNNGFESGDAEWRSNVGSLLIVNDGEARTGSYAARKVTETTVVDADQLTNLLFDARPGEVFYLECWVRYSADADGDARIKVDWYGVDGYLSSSGPDGIAVAATPFEGYQRCAGFVRAPLYATTGEVAVLVESHTAGTWWIDDAFARRYDRAWYQDVPYAWDFPFIVAATRTGGAGAQGARIPSAIGVEHRIRSTTRVAVVPGERMVLSGWVRASGTGAYFTMEAAYYTEAGTYVGTETAGLETPAPTYWRRYYAVHSVPSGAQVVEITIRTDDASTAAVNVDFDDVSLRRVIPCRFLQDTIAWQYLGYRRFAATVEMAESP